MGAVMLERVVIWISENPYLATAALFATFIALIITIITPILQKKRKRMCFSVSNTELVSNTATRIPGLDILFHGNHICRLCVSTINLWNSGNTIITPEDLYKGYELCLKATGEVTILGISKITPSEKAVAFNIRWSPSIVFPSFQALEKKGKVSFTLYHTGGEETAFVLKGKLKEGKIINKTKDIEKQTSRVMDGGQTQWILALVLSVILFLLITFFAYMIGAQYV